VDHPLPDVLMEIEITDRGAFASASVTLAPDETFVSEAGCYVHSTPNVDIDVTTRRRSKGGGGLLGGLKSMLAGESFFLSRYSSTDGGAATLHLAPGLPGDVRQVDLDGSSRWLCFGGSYLGSGSELDLDTEGQGFKGFFSGESLFAIGVSGKGRLLVQSHDPGSYGRRLGGLLPPRSS